MSKGRFELNTAGVRELLHDVNLSKACMEQAQRIAKTAGEGFVAEARNYPARAGAAVRPDSDEAFFRNLRENTLLKAVGK